MYVLHTNMPEVRTRTRQCQYGWTKSTNIKTFECDGDLVWYIPRRGGGGGGGGENWGTGKVVVWLVRLKAIHWPNARGRVRGIAVLCFVFKWRIITHLGGNELRCNWTKLLINFDFAELNCYAIFKKVNYSLLSYTKGKLRADKYAKIKDYRV